jgi:hypothetical protein
MDPTGVASRHHHSFHPAGQGDHRHGAPGQDATDRREIVHPPHRIREMGAGDVELPARQGLQRRLAVHRDPAQAIFREPFPQMRGQQRQGRVAPSDEQRPLQDRRGDPQGHPDPSRASAFHEEAVGRGVKPPCFLQRPRDEALPHPSEAHPPRRRLAPPDPERPFGLQHLRRRGSREQILHPAREGLGQAEGHRHVGQVPAGLDGAEGLPAQPGPPRQLGLAQPLPLPDLPHPVLPTLQPHTPSHRIPPVRTHRNGNGFRSICQLSLTPQAPEGRAQRGCAPSAGAGVCPKIVGQLRAVVPQGGLQ